MLDYYVRVDVLELNTELWDESFKDSAAKVKRLFGPDCREVSWSLSAEYLDWSSKDPTLNGRGFFSECDAVSDLLFSSSLSLFLESKDGFTGLVLKPVELK